ncbi:hypothetical protein L226DRAFT_493735 [Lentinus tigrinus ALCF2SS1-7]|uniref:BTB domain-containing protein n=1 Tax=Lentinus tigrinus ALCF2SS1-6 TaxID=1328759 RepID=A0A5C2S4Z4_9APHY|nr:hypothetical protein L227DRAFT_550182 [Lentinus tigrinus ALCF2SS1-6]RPD69778.1 hypothetical protein L226DRAFT_493735 [Lentinus tigrinus ALCF2SS1-7]
MDALGLSQREWLNTYSGLESSSARAHDPVVEASTISLDRWTGLSSFAFGPEFMIADALPDVVLVTTDQVRLHAHLRRLLHASANSFAGLLADVPQGRTIVVPERSQVLLIALRVLYGLPCLHIHPALDDVELAMGALLKYGVDLRRLAEPSLPLYHLVLSFSSSHPINAYCIAARYDLEDVAVMISSGLLMYDLSVLPDALAAKMGPTYYKRLTDLQRLRESALRELLDSPLDSHPPSPVCDDDGQRQLETIWKAAIVKAVWHGSFDIIAQSVLGTYEEERTKALCVGCKSALEERMEDAARKWASVKHVTEHA